MTDNIQNTHTATSEHQDMDKRKCSLCGNDLPDPEYDGDTPPELNGKFICYNCWGIEYENKTPIIIDYRMTSYVQGQENIMKSEGIRLDELPAFIDKLFRKTGYYVDFILLKEGDR